jgi:hypothetical protein
MVHVRTRWFAAILLVVVFAACSGDTPAATFVQAQLAHKERGQIGPRYLIAQGPLPHGTLWLLIAHRRIRNQMCVGFAWHLENPESGTYEGTCPAHEKPRPVIHNGVARPLNTEELFYVYGLIKDTDHAEKVRVKRQAATQEIKLIRHPSFPGDAFYVGKLELPELPETIELVTADGKVVRSEEFRW